MERFARLIFGSLGDALVYSIAACCYAVQIFESKRQNQHFFWEEISSPEITNRTLIALKKEGFNNLQRYFRPYMRIYKTISASRNMAWFVSQ